MDGHTNAVLCLLVNNRLMYSGGADSVAKCWVTEFGDGTRSYKGHRHSVCALKFQKGIRESVFFLLLCRWTGGDILRIPFALL